MHPLQQHLVQICKDHAEKTAVGYSRKQEQFRHSFAEILSRANAVAHVLATQSSSVFAITSDKNEVPSIAILAAILTGKAFVPINPQWPEQRVSDVLRCLNVKTILTSQGISYGLAVIDPRDLRGSDQPLIQGAQGGDVLYIVPTSGTTGEPKLIQITYDNVWAYLQNFFSIAQLNADDVIGHISELNFDVAIGDILWSLYSGATLLPIRFEQLLEAPKILQSWQATVWSSAPSVAKNIVTFYSQREGQFPSLKKTFFIGEKLFKSVVDSWISVFPSTQVYNVYGPAEATVSISYYKYQSDCEDEVLPIGSFYSQQKALLFDHEKQQESSQQGELLIHGSQVMKAYVNPQMNEHSFFTYDNRLWYRTGDLVLKKKNEYFFISRIDSQIKIAGQRFELDEIEIHLKAVYPGVFAHVVPYYFDELKNPMGLVAVVDQKLSSQEKLSLQAALRRTLPLSFIPREFVALPSLPLNASGKLDREKLLTLISVMIP